MRFMFRNVCATLWLVLWSHPAVGQLPAVEPGPRLTSLREPWEPSALTRSHALGTLDAGTLSSKAKWALGGALIGGVLSAAVANALCERQSGCAGPTITWGLIGGALGAAAGALIGRNDKQ